ncbi:MAG TPA: hypothetical protein VFB13_10705 [Reyranella sp.]|jgi:hypothetical protein|nr:hypothetical protein [Reyranella sp.]
MFAGIDLRDLIVIASCVVVFIAAIALAADKEHRHFQAGRPPFAGPPLAEMAQALDIPAYRLRNAFEEVGPPSRTPSQPPTEQQLAEHARRLAVALDVPVDRLRLVLAAHKPPAL